MAGSAKLSNPGFIWPYEDPPIYESFEFEKFDVVKVRDWMEANWWVSIYICAIYTIAVILGIKIMEKRKPLELKFQLSVWNLAMALFSFMGLSRCLPELLYVLMGDEGFHRSICVRDNHTQAAAFWAWMFTLSKVVELGDTMFIVLRKKKLMFIHFYHHAVALVVCWCYYSDYEPITRWFGIINFAVHTVLYSYLFLKSINLSLPKSLPNYIIGLELGQMLVNIAVNIYAVLMKAQGVPCARSMKATRVHMMLYASFVLMFAYLFAESYRQRNTRKKSI